MKKLISTLIDGVKLERKLSQEPLDPQYEEQMRMWGQGIFRLVVMGEIKKGKSSFINAMLGIKDLVPVSSNVATSTIFKIRYGEKQSYKVHFTKDSQKAPLDIDFFDLNRFGTEDGNLGNKERVAFIEVTCPSPVLQSGIVVIDTPGLGGLFKEHKKITYKYVPRADAVFFITDSIESPIGQLELEYLRDIKRITPHFYFVQTKCIAVDSDAKEARKQNNISILSRELKLEVNSIPYFLVDSELKFEADADQNLEDLEDSGYPQLMTFIKQKLQPNQHKILVQKALLTSLPYLDHLQEIIENKKALISADSEAKRFEQENAINKAQKDLQNWQNDKLPEIKSGLEKGLSLIQLNATKDINKCRPSGEIQGEFENVIYSAIDIDDLKNKVSQIEQKLPEYASLIMAEVTRKLQNEAFELLNSLSQSSSTELAICDSSHNTGLQINTNSLKRMKNLSLNSEDLFQTVRAGFYGGMAGATIASVVGGLIGSVIPIVGTVIGSTLGVVIASAWGGHKAVSIQKEQELKSAKQQVCNALSQSLSSLHAELQSRLMEIVIEIKSETTRIISNFIRTRSNELSKQMEAIKNRANMDAQELNKSKHEIMLLEQSMQKINQIIEPWQKEIA